VFRPLVIAESTAGHVMEERKYKPHFPKNSDVGDC
jgi:hypothetical protein